MRWAPAMAEPSRRPWRAPLRPVRPLAYAHRRRERTVRRGLRGETGPEPADSGSPSQDRGTDAGPAAHSMSACRSAADLAGGGWLAKTRADPSCRGPGEAQTKVGWLTKQRAMEVCQSKCLRGPGDVEQQGVRRYDEKHIDRVSAFEHFRTSRFGRCIESEIPRRRQVRSDGCLKLIQTRRCVARQRIADSVT